MNDRLPKLDTPAAYSSTPVLVVAGSDGWVEVFADENTDVHVVVLPHMTSPAGEIAAEEYLEESLPPQHQAIFWPGMRRAADQVRTIRPSDIVKRDWELEMLQAIETAGEILHGTEPDTKKGAMMQRSTTTPGSKVPQLYNAALVEETIRLIIGGGQVTELRILNATTASDRWVRTYSGYFDNAKDLSAALKTIKSAQGIYITPNPVDPDLLARSANRIRKPPQGESTGDVNIIRRKWLLIDCDAQRLAGISATDAEHDAAIDCAREIYKHLHGAGWPEPIAADSGNGAHLLYRVDLPRDDGGLVKRCLEALAALFDCDAVHVDQTVFNPSRIWKLYGTLACKGDNVPDRPHRMSRILNAPDDIQTTGQALLEALAGTVQPSESVATVQGENSARHTGNGVFDLESFITQNGLDVSDPSDWHGGQGLGRSWSFRTSPMCEHHDGSVHLEQHASGAISAGCHHNSCSWKWQDLRRQVTGQLAGEVHVSASPASVDGTVPVAAKSTAVHEFEPFQQFPTDYLPQPVRGFVIAGAKSIGCDRSYLSLPLLTVLASAVGNSRRIRLKRGWDAPAIIWTAIVGESGTSKTPAFKLAMQPIRDRQSKALKRHAEEMTEHEVTMARYDKDLAAWTRDKNTEQPPPAKPLAPLAERCIVGDATVESLAPLLLENPRGLLLARDELSGWIGSFDKYSGGQVSGDSSFWLSSHNGEGIVVDRKTGKKRTMYIPQASVSVVGGIQPAILRRALGTEHWESGLAARLLLTCPPRQTKRWTEADIDPAAEEVLAGLVGQLFELQPTTNDDGEPRPVVVGLSRDAKAVWKRYYNDHAEEQTDLSGNLAAAWSKLEEYAARLALVIHFTRWAANDAELHHPDVVDVESMLAGIELAEWFKTETRRVYSLLAESDADHDQRCLADWIERKGGSVTTREVQQGHRQYRTAQDADAALDELAKTGYGGWESTPPGQPGRPTRRFVLTTALTVYGNTLNLEENTNTVDVDSVDSPETRLDDDWGDV